MLAAFFLLGYILLSVLFPRPVQACVETLEKRPLGSFFAGLMVIVLLGPLVVLLVVSAIGIAILPFLFCAMVAAFLFGKVAVYSHTGRQLGVQLGLAAVRKPLQALVFGTALFYLLYIIPVVGFLVWGLIVPLGIGASVLAFFRSFRSESASVSARLAPPVTLATELPGGASGQPAVPPLLLARVGFWRRFVATLLDYALLAMLLRLLDHLPMLFLFLWVAYHVVMWAWRGTTIGGIVVGIKIIRPDGRPINFAVALVRALAGIFSAMVFFLGFFWAGWDREKQAWHDNIAGTIVVRVPKGASLI